MRPRSRQRYFALALLVAATRARSSPQDRPQTVPAGPASFTNPLRRSGPDPWVTFRDGVYYYTSTTGNNITIWKTGDITALGQAERQVVWRPPSSGAWSHDIWAPELHFIAGKWYLYFSADSGEHFTHRIWVLENSSPDPLAGEWVMKGKAADSSADTLAIDGTVFEAGGRLYLAWSGWEGDRDGEQDLYLARLGNPWTIEGRRMRLSRPRYDWEKRIDVPGHGRLLVNEGPEALIRDGKIFLTYSAGACWTDDAALGMLQARTDADLMKTSSWAKSPVPVFTSSPEAQAFGVGHNGFFQSPDGKEDWIIYHARAREGTGCGQNRTPRAQRFTWKPDGTPDFGMPVPLGALVPKPSGL